MKITLSQKWKKALLFDSAVSAHSVVLPFRTLWKWLVSWAFQTHLDIELLPRRMTMRGR